MSSIFWRLDPFLNQGSTFGSNLTFDPFLNSYMVKIPDRTINLQYLHHGTQRIYPAHCTSNN